MKFKLVQSEADGLFMKANRKNQILLNFELKRIAVEQKMRERYFSFEKSLVVAHHNKIIARQKALGIYRPQTTPEKKRRADSFFITNVAMGTKAQSKLPPVREMQRKASHKELQHTSKFKFATRNSGSNKSNVNIARESLPNLAPSWSFTEVPERSRDAGSFPSIINAEPASNNEISNDNLNKDLVGVSKTEQSDMANHVQISETSAHEAKCQILKGSENQINHNKAGMQKKNETERAAGKSCSDMKIASVQPSNSSEVHQPKNGSVQNRNSSSNFVHKSEKSSHSDSASQKLSKKREEGSVSTVGATGIQRPKSVHLRSVGVRTGLTNLSLRAHSAGARGT